MEIDDLRANYVKLGLDGRRSNSYSEDLKRGLFSRVLIVPHDT
jgi:hypothetical protein